MPKRGFTLHTESLAKKLNIRPQLLVHSYFRVSSLHNINARLKKACPKHPKKHLERIKYNRAIWNRFVLSQESDEASYLIPTEWDKFRHKYILDF